MFIQYEVRFTNNDTPSMKHDAWYTKTYADKRQQA